jgi:hypothetical protein
VNPAALSLKTGLRRAGKVRDIHLHPDGATTMPSRKTTGLASR